MQNGGESVEISMDAQFQSESKVHFYKPYMRVSAFSYKNYSIEPHTHDFYEMNIVLGGKGRHIIEGASFDVRTGDVFMIPPFTVHAYVDTECLEVYHVLIHKRFIAENSKEAYSMKGFSQFVEIEPYLRSHGADAMFLHLSGNDLMHLRLELEFIEDGGVCDGEAGAPMKHHATWKILYWLSRLLYEQGEKKGVRSGSKYDQLIINTLEYIHSSYAEKITTATLCERIYLSRSTFLRNFEEMCGCSPMKYLNDYRCKRALELSEGGKMNKTDIAHACGFYDLSHLEKSLKSYKK